MEHLKKDIWEMVDKTKEERIDFILRDSWIGYPKSKDIIDKLNFLLKHPKINRMPNLLLVGDTNNGKTQLLSRFLQTNKPFIDEEKEELHVPVLYVQAPPMPDEKRFYNAILDSTYTPYRINDKLDKRQSQVLNVMKKISVKILIIDEIQHILGGTMSRRISFLNVIKYLSNELKISIVGAGTKDAFHAISTDPQLSNRFEPAVLPKWTYDENFLKLLASFEYIMPLKKPSLLAKTPSLSKKIFLLSEGTIGEITTLIKRSAVKAIELGEERITESIINAVEFVPPSERRYSPKHINA